MLFEEWCWSGAPNDVGTRSLIIIAANGEFLSYGLRPAIVMFNSSDFTFEEVTQIINGGTGRFENATGEFKEFVEITFGDETELFSEHFH